MTTNRRQPGSRFLNWDGRVTEMALFDYLAESNAREPSRGQCPTCSGMGRLVEQIDDDRFPVTVPCHRCKGKGVLSDA